MAFLKKIKLPNESNARDIYDAGAIRYTEKGSANGVAELDNNGKVPSSQLPSYVDDVLEYNSKSAFPATGESGKIYVDKATNLTWRWSGSTYVEISPSLALGETSSTAYRGDKGKANADAIVELQTGLGGKENLNNKVTLISSQSTNTQYPSAKAVYDYVPVNVSSFTNDAGYLTLGSLPVYGGEVD